MAINGYTPGGGRQFTPSLEAKWTEDFNELLNQYNKTHKYSRNRLTEKCLELGVKMLKEGIETPDNTVNDGILIPIGGLSKEHMEFLNSPMGRNALTGIVKMLLLGEPLKQFSTETEIFTSNTGKDIQYTKGEQKEQHLLESAATKEINEPENNKNDLHNFYDKLDKFGGI